MNAEKQDSQTQFASLALLLPLRTLVEGKIGRYRPGSLVWFMRAADPENHPASLRAVCSSAACLHCLIRCDRKSYSMRCSLLGPSGASGVASKSACHVLGSHLEHFLLFGSRGVGARKRWISVRVEGVKIMICQLRDSVERAVEGLRNCIPYLLPPTRSWTMFRALTCRQAVSGPSDWRREVPYVRSSGCSCIGKGARKVVDSTPVPRTCSNGSLPRVCWSIHALRCRR